MPNDKSPGNGGLNEEFSETCKTKWSEVKQTFLSRVSLSFDKGEVCTWQRQSITKLVEKKDKDKRLISNWRPISLLNVHAKIISKPLLKNLNNVLPSLISDNQSTYADGRFIRRTFNYRYLANNWYVKIKWHVSYYRHSIQLIINS